jgi:hypothetical protein
MSMIVKVQPGTPFIPAGMPTDSTREACQVRPCPLEIKARQVNGPYWVGGPDDGKFVVDIVPVDGDSDYPGYYSSVDAHRISIDGRTLHIVRVAECHVTPVPMFVMDAETAMEVIREDQIEVGNFPSCYNHTMDEEMWSVKNADGEDVTPE